MSDPIFAYGLIALGLLLLFAEFLLPTGLVLGALGIAALLVGVAMSFMGNPTRGLVTLIAVFTLLPILMPLAIKYWPRTAIGRRLILEGPDEDASVAVMPNHLELERLRGRHGRTVSALRPSGVTEFDGKRIDTITEGEMIDVGHWVRCVDVRAGRVIVRRVEKPPDLGEFSPDDLKG